MGEFKGTLLGMLLVISVFGAVGGTIKATMSEKAKDIGSKYDESVTKIQSSSKSHIKLMHFNPNI